MSGEVKEQHTGEKTCTVTLCTIKSEEWGALIYELGLDEDVARRHFEHGEYADLELTINADLKVVGGKVIGRP